MPNVAKAKPIAPTRKSATNVKALQVLLKSMEREVTKLGKELEKLRHLAAQAPATKQLARRGAASAKTATNSAKETAASAKAAKTKRRT